MKTYPITIDPQQSLAERIADCHFTYVNRSIIVDNFPDNIKETSLVVEIMKIEKSMSTTKILAKMEETNVRPCTLVELLAFAKMYPHEEKDHFIIALGSAWVSSDGDRSVPFLGKDGSDRKLRLRWDGPGNAWHEHCRFLVVSKSSDTRSPGPLGLGHFTFFPCCGQETNHVCK